jgi:hypothetical protein
MDPLLAGTMGEKNGTEEATEMIQWGLSYPDFGLSITMNFSKAVQ